MLAKIVFNVFILLLLLPFVMLAQDNGEFQRSDYRWKNRLLFVFAPSQESAEHKEQMKELNSRHEGVLDRDLKIFHFFSDDESYGDGMQIDKKTTEKLYQAYDVNPDRFTVVLIGKDGTEKLRTRGLLKIKQLFGRIDSMPMRQREMRDQGN